VVFDVSLNRTQHRFKRFKYEVIFEPEDTNALLLQKLHAFHVVFGTRRIEVTLSIEFHCEPTGRTVEVYNIRSHAMLTTEFPAADLGTPQVLPQQRLSRSQ